MASDLPFGRIALLLNLCEDTLGLVVDAMAAFGHLAVALDLLFPAHVTSLVCLSECRPPVHERTATHPRDAPALGVILIQPAIGIVAKVCARRQ
jgi:hypothetical protein